MKPLYLSFADNGNIYFCSMDKNNDSDIYLSEYKNGSYLPLVPLSFNDKKISDFDPVVSTDERFIIFTSNSRKGLGLSDLWVSFKKDGKWTEPVNMGDKVNSRAIEGNPCLSRDNKTLYFSSSPSRGTSLRPVYKNRKPTTEEIISALTSAKNGVHNLYI